MNVVAVDWGIGCSAKIDYVRLLLLWTGELDVQQVRLCVRDLLLWTRELDVQQRQIMRARLVAVD